MKAHGWLIMLAVILALIPIFYLNRWLQTLIRPREAAARFFLYMIANFLLVIIYTILLVSLVIKLFPLH